MYFSRSLMTKCWHPFKTITPLLMVTTRLFALRQQLKQQRDKLRQYQKRIQQQQQKERLLAKQLLKDGKKEWVQVGGMRLCWRHFRVFFFLFLASQTDRFNSLVHFVLLTEKLCCCWRRNATRTNSWTRLTIRSATWSSWWASGASVNQLINKQTNPMSHVGVGMLITLLT